MKIVVGAISTQRFYSAGNQCNWLHWVEGLRRLGHEVYFVEQVHADECVDAAGETCGFEQSIARRRFHATMEQFGLLQNACLLSEDGHESAGLSLRNIERVARDADLLINFSGCVSASIVMDNVRRRAFIDTDPVYTQIWHADYGVDVGLRDHDAWFTVGLNIGTPFSPIPDCGLPWRPVGRPMVLDMWSDADRAPGPRFTTVASWKIFGDVRHDGEWYCSKAHELDRFIGIPRLTEQELEIVLRVHWDGANAANTLRSNGWHVIDAERISDLSSYASYIARSRAEIGIAKHAYVKGSSGWFSDRSAHYLACGRPVLHQSTGFERSLPVGLGILSFVGVDDVVKAIDEINCAYEQHCRAAREFAAEFLDYRRIIPAMLDQCMTPAA